MKKGPFCDSGALSYQELPNSYIRKKVLQGGGGYGRTLASGMGLGHSLWSATEPPEPQTGQKPSSVGHGAGQEVLSRS